MPPIEHRLDRICDVLANIARLTVHAECQGCAHVAGVDWLAMGGRHGLDMKLKLIAPLMRCTRCGARGCRWHVTPRTSASVDPSEPEP